MAGSIIHMGEGVNPWDLGLFSVGVVLFVAGSVAMDIRQGGKRLKEEGIFKFLLLSLFLSIGIGMASGGIQHFDDTPQYSAILIPLGISIGLLAYILKERITLSVKEWIVLLPSTVILMLLAVNVLWLAGNALPDSLRGDHAHTSNESSTTGDSSVEVKEPEPHGH